MESETLHGLYFVFGLLVFIWLAAKAVLALKNRNTNIGLWATVFDGMTQGSISLEPLKEPEVFIEKKARRDGDKDPESAKNT